MRARPVSCCFSGHRPAKLPWGGNENDPRCMDLKQRLWDAMEAAYEEGYRHFICGMAQGCDFYFCELAIQLRAKYGDVSVEAAIPCATQSQSWSAAEQRRWRQLRIQTRRSFCWNGRLEWDGNSALPATAVVI